MGVSRVKEGSGDTSEVLKLVCPDSQVLEWYQMSLKRLSWSLMEYHRVLEAVGKALEC